MQGVRYSIERTSNRHSRATLRDGVIRIRLARGLPHAEELRHIDSLLKRMTKAAVQETTRTRIDPFQPLLRGETSLAITPVSGSAVTLQLLGSAHRTKAHRIDGGWSIVRDTAVGDRQFQRFLWKLLSASLAEETTALVSRVNAETFGVPITTVTLKYMRSRWGSCAHHGGIALATPLFLTTPEILRYVIIHELAHRIHPNHSANFWEAVGNHEPAYKQHVRALRNYHHGIA